MFGYLRPFVPELKVREDLLYKGIYCGICKTLGRRVGRTARLTLSYDAVFLALLLAAVQGESFTQKEGRCALHPLKKRPVTLENQPMRLAAAASCVLFAYKVEDERQDEKGIRRLAAMIASPLVRRQRKKASGLLPGDLSALPAAFAALADSEAAAAGRTASAESDVSRTESGGLERCADCMGEILKILFSACDPDPLASEVLGKIGYHLGRWIYIADAADDFDDDLQKKRFNPFAPEKPAPEMLLAALENQLLAVDGIMGKLKIQDPLVDALLRNILYEGLYLAERRIAFGENIPGGDGRIEEIGSDDRKDQTKQ